MSTSAAPQALSQPPLKKSTQWTNRLGSLVDEEKAKASLSDNSNGGVTPSTLRTMSSGFSDAISNYEVETPLRLEGPYFTPANPEAYKTVVCLVAGTGLSGAIAIAAAFQAQQRARPRSTLRAPALARTMASESTRLWERCIVIWTVREDSFVDMQEFFRRKCALHLCENYQRIIALESPGLEFRVHKTGGAQPRPNMSEALMGICGDKGRDCWCYISGPNGFISAAEQSCSQIKSLNWFAARWD